MKYQPMKETHKPPKGWQDVFKRVLHRALSSKQPSIIEGTAVLVDPNVEGRKILLVAPKKSITSTRMRRFFQRRMMAHKPISKVEEKNYARESNQIHRVYDPLVRRLMRHKDVEVVDMTDKLASAGGYSGAATAHEMGHAASLVRPDGSTKRLRSAAYAASPLIGILASMPFARRGKAGLSALVAASGFAPVLAEEGTASLKAIRGLRQSGASPKQLSRAKKDLGLAYSTYLGVTGLAGLQGGLSGLSRRGRISSKLDLGVSALAAIGAIAYGHAIGKALQRTDYKIDRKAVDKLKTVMGVPKTVGIHDVKPGEGIKSSAFAPPAKTRLGKAMNRATLKRLTGDKDVEKILAGGGILLGR